MPHECKQSNPIILLAGANTISFATAATGQPNSADDQNPKSSSIVHRGENCGTRQSTLLSQSDRFPLKNAFA
jgi:hypothetical protein